MLLCPSTQGATVPEAAQHEIDGILLTRYAPDSQNATAGRNK